MSVLNDIKPSVATMTNESMPSTIWNRYGKDGQGWLYDQPEITYDGVIDPISGLPVTYDGLGTATSFTNEAKTNA